MNTKPSKDIVILLGFVLLLRPIFCEQLSSKYRMLLALMSSKRPIASGLG
jgi:hypothetical protein